MSFLSFFLGVLTGLMTSLFFVWGVRVRGNLERVGTVSGRIEPQTPVLRTDREEAELEEELNAER